MSYPPDRHKKLYERNYQPRRGNRGPAPPPMITTAPRGLSGLCFFVAFIMGYVAFVLYGEGASTWEDAATIASIAALLGMILSGGK